MKKLKFKFDLNSRVAIYVPSTTDAVNSCDNSGMVKYVLTELSNMFGGATATPAIGGWVSESHGLITENVTIVYAFCKSEDFAKRIGDVLAICEKIKNDMQQEAVTLEYNGQIAFI